MKRFCLPLLVCALGLAILAGCNGGTKVHIEEERSTEETRPVVTGDEASSYRIFRMDEEGNVHLEEETTTETTRPIITGD